MKKNIKGIDYEWLVKSTGDPFADAGGFAIEYLFEKFPNIDIEELIEYITKIYVNKWQGKLNAFFLNSKITQPAFQGSKKIDETLKYFDRLIKETEPYEIGYCRITGQETKLFYSGRDNSIMTGSGTLINFHHNFQKGIALSKEAIIRIHFVPFACQQLQGKIGLMQSSNQNLSRFFVRSTVDKNLHEIGLGISEGVTKSELNRPVNAIFNFVNDALSQLNDLVLDSSIPSLTLYHFTNFGATPDIKLYQLHSKVFLFYRTCTQIKFRDDWQNFIRSNYYDSQNKGVKYDVSNGQFILSNAKELVTIEYNEYKQWYNRIFQKLILEESLLTDFLRWIKLHKFNFTIVSIYQQHIRGMKKETINKIKELASFLVREEDADKIKKRIKTLDGAKNASMLRRFLLKDVVNANYTGGNKYTILTIEEYLNYLFPDGSYWAEIRDLLLIAIYQELHEKGLISEELKIELEAFNDNEIIN